MTFDSPQIQITGNDWKNRVKEKIMERHHRKRGRATLKYGVMPKYGPNFKAGLTKAHSKWNVIKEESVLGSWEGRKNSSVDGLAGFSRRSEIGDGVVGFNIEKSMNPERSVIGSRLETKGKDKKLCTPVPVLVKR